MQNFNYECQKIYRFVTSPIRLLPDFIIAGEAKCGTSSLYRYLCKHPDVVRADIKEPTNFINYPTSALRSRMHFPTRLNKIFRASILRRKTITGEASVEYLSNMKTPAFVHRIVPNVKLIIMMRNPIDRAYSDYQMMRKGKTETGDFDAIVQRSIEWLGDTNLEPLINSLSQIANNPVRYVLKGLYLRHIQNWLQFFPRENFLFLKSEDFFSEPAKVHGCVCDFLGLAAHQLNHYKVARKGDYEKVLSVETVSRLLDFYRPHNENLYKFLGQDLGWEQKSAEMLTNINQTID